MLPPLAFVRFVVLLALGLAAAGILGLQQTRSSVPLEAAPPAQPTARSGLLTPTPETPPTPTRTEVPTATRTPLPTPTNTPKPSPMPVPSPTPEPATGDGASTQGAGAPTSGGQTSGSSGAVSAPAAPQPAPPPPSGDRLDAGFASQVLALVNAERSARGIAPLRSNGALTQAASDYALLLLGYPSLSHTANGTALQGRASAAGYGGGYLGEVLWQGRGVFSPADVVASWMNSPPHRAIILDPTYRDAGVGCAFGGGGATQQSRCAMDVGA